MNILVIFTGGTIGSTKNDGWVSLDPAKRYTLIGGYLEEHSGDISFDTYSPFTMHSETLSAHKLTLLINCLCENVGKAYDGIVVTHGTDTLQYSASAAAFCLGTKCVPIVFVSSNFPLEDKNANGKLNFEAAVEFIRSKQGTGVYISYSNDGKIVELHYAERVFYHPELSDHICSADAPPFYYSNGKVLKRDLPDIPFRSAKPFGAVDFCKDPKLLYLSVTPFERYYYKETDYNAVVLSPYHSGTVNTESSEFKAFCQRFNNAAVPVFLPDVPIGSAYDSMREFEALGITVLPNSVQIPLLMKLWIAVSKGEKDLIAFVKTPIGREIIL